jgi:Flp pilus assembly protein TadD
VLAYLRLLVWPSGQNIDHEFLVSRGVLDPPETLLAGLALAALAASAVVLVVRARHRADASARAGRLVGFGVLWFLVVLAPTSSFVPLVDVVEEHRVYLASFGIVMAAGAGGSFVLARLAGARASTASAVASGAIWCALAVSLYARNAVWTSGEALWADAVSKSPTKARAHASYARELASANKLGEAISEYRLALRCAADGSVLRAFVLENLAALLGKLGRRDEAFVALRDALEEAPGEPTIEANLAVWHLGGDDLPRAHELAEDAFRQIPHDPTIRNIYGVVLMREGRNQEALEHFRIALAAAGHDLPPAAFNLATVAERLGMIPEACAAWAFYAESAASPAADETGRERRRALGCR